MHLAIAGEQVHQQQRLRVLGRSFKRAEQLQRRLFAVLITGARARASRVCCRCAHVNEVVG